jgi:catechol-2,3-dioxygenase
MMKLTGINQITLRVNDLRESEAFYIDILGLGLDHRVGANITYLRINSDLLVLVKAETPGTREARDIRVDHFGFRLPSNHEVDDAAAYLESHGVHLVTRPSNRREGRAFFVMDPDGNLVEFYSMRDSGIDKGHEGIDTSSPSATLPVSAPEDKPRRSRK